MFGVPILRFQHLELQICEAQRLEFYFCNFLGLFEYLANMEPISRLKMTSLFQTHAEDR